jgi:hypothetical protein
MFRSIRVAVFVVCLGFTTAAAHAAPIVDFEGLIDGESLTSQIPGFTFTNATVLTAGLTLNEFEFPPASGSNVAADDGGPMRIDFASPIAAFSGRFTYSASLTLAAYDPFDTPLASVTSAFLENFVSSGGIPNELLELAAANISYVTITGLAFGGSFTVDDVSARAVPEPATALLVALGAAAVVRRRRRTNA